MMRAMLYGLFRLLHFIGILLLAGAVIIENLATRPTLSQEDAHNLARVDAFAGLGAVLTLLCGMLLWFVVGKPAAFYSENPVFHAKLGLFLLLILLAAYPAWFFFRHRRTGSDRIPVPGAVRLILRLELGLLLLLPVTAFLMARGVGLG